jgi:nucleoid-associated protein YgaU
MATKTKKTAAKRTTAAKGKAIKTAKKPAAKAAKAAKAKPAAKADAPKAGTKKALLLQMLSGKGATNTDLCKALGWLPHTLRAAICRIENVEHSRADGVTTYRLGA